jgi:hypothetical protein
LLALIPQRTNPPPTTTTTTSPLLQWDPNDPYHAEELEKVISAAFPPAFTRQPARRYAPTRPPLQVSQKSKKKSMRERRQEKAVRAVQIQRNPVLFLMPRPPVFRGSVRDSDCVFQSKEEARKAAAANNAELQVQPALHLLYVTAPSAHPPPPPSPRAASG